MKEQVAFCDAILADLVRLFPQYPFRSNADSVKLGGLLQITMPAEVACRLIAAFVAAKNR
jgi:hypothetical protein